MRGSEGTPGRRLRVLHLPRRQDEEPRVDALTALLRDVDDLRLTLETDLTLAASAVEAGNPAVALEILDSDSKSVRKFEDRALEHLADLEEPPHRRRIWANVHAGPVVAAAALVAVLAGVVPQALQPHDSGAANYAAATSTVERIQELAAQGETAQVRVAANQLHAQLASVLTVANTDPAAAQQALMLLSYEQSAIVHSGDSVALADVLRQAAALASAIRAALPPGARPAEPKVGVQPAPSAAPKPQSSPKPSPKPSAKASTKPSSSASAKPSSSSSPADCNPLPACGPTAPVP